MAMSARLFDLMDEYSGDRDAYGIEMQLNKLLGLLRIHLAQEDVELYPELADSDDQQVARLARLRRECVEVSRKLPLTWKNSRRAGAG